jgi:hypothetical protein
MLTRVIVSAVLSVCILGAGFAVVPPSSTSNALAQNPNNRLVTLRDGFVLNYDRAKGKCTVVKGNAVIQDTPCRTTWTAIASGGRRVLFYDRTAREIEIYRLNSDNSPSDGIGSRLKRYGPAEKVRGTWANITHIGNAVYRFTDDTGQFEDYRLDDKDILQRNRATEK